MTQGEQTITGAPLPGTVTTRLVHRPPPGTAEWWHSCVIWLGAPPLLEPGADGAERSAGMRAAARLGAQAIRIGCPPLPGEASAQLMDAAAELLARAHRRGLRVIARIDPASPRDEAAARHWLERGMDGLDLGPVDAEHEVSHQRYRELHAMLAAYASGEDPILSTRLSVGRQHRTGEMLHEDWLHHLVDPMFRHVADPRRIVDGLTESYRVRDALGAPGAWLVPDARDAGSVPRVRALALLVLALPGAVYLREGTAVGLAASAAPGEPPVDRDAIAAAREEQRGVADSTFELFRAALRLRGEHRLGTAPLAIVEDETLAPSTLALLSGELLVVANLGEDEVALSTEHEVLLASTAVSAGSGGRPMLPPGHTAWQWLEPHRQPRDPRVRR